MSRRQPTVPPSGPLSRAVAAQDLYQMKCLLDSAAKGQSRLSDNDRAESMRLAVEGEHLSMVELLLERGIRPSVWDFSDAVSRCSYPMLALLCLNGYDLNQPVSEDRPGPLADALFDPGLVRWLVEHGADPNGRCKYDITPFSIAAGTASQEVIELLLELGASTQSGYPLHHAVRAQRDDAVILLLLKHGANVNAVMFENDPVGYREFQSLGLGTPLHEATPHAMDRLFNLLLRQGGDPRIRNSLGDYPGAKAPYDQSMCFM